MEAENRVIKALAGSDARDQTLEMFRKKLRDGDLDDKEISIEIQDNSLNLNLSDLTNNITGANNPGIGSINLMDLFNFSNPGKKRRKC